jgi:hypothetical protein
MNKPITPDRWVVLELPNGYYKVFATWVDDRWRLNSGIKTVEQDEEFYYFIGFSGSRYKCHKKGYGVATSYGLDLLNEIIQQGKGQIELMENADWAKVV